MYLLQLLGTNAKKIRLSITPFTSVNNCNKNENLPGIPSGSKNRHPCGSVIFVGELNQ
ncbi:hypothetical protein N44_01912 [Microcystis aeruginosa NIES-44]|uniref:Uncharacterized protein n=1 Tax=Microcystis aeruginosa NIES-44 TaxID=449439 RepID=A0A0A1VU11_MICAE|nr:hypothetical protein N44_01912 [Microcystis aeruginosa NIES-44]